MGFRSKLEHDRGGDCLWADDSGIGLVAWVLFVPHAADPDRDEPTH